MLQDRLTKRATPDRNLTEYPRHFGLLSRQRGVHLVRDGKIIAAAQEERFTCRKKHDAAFPKNAGVGILPA